MMVGAGVATVGDAGVAARGSGLPRDEQHSSGKRAFKFESFDARLKYKFDEDELDLSEEKEFGSELSQGTSVNMDNLCNQNLMKHH